MENKYKKGKYVRVVSDSSYRHFKKIGKIVGYCNNPCMVWVYFSETKIKARFYLSSLELVN